MEFGMRIKKIALTIIVTVLSVFILGMFQTSNAATGSLWLDIRMLRDSGFGYKALEKNVWKIVCKQAIINMGKNNVSIFLCYCL